MIEGKVVAITGASSGIGEATALHLAERGANLILGARREEGLARLTAAIEGAGGHASYKVADVSKRDDLHDLMRLAQQKYGRLDGNSREEMQNVHGDRSAGGGIKFLKSDSGGPPFAPGAVDRR